VRFGSERRDRIEASNFIYDFESDADPGSLPRASGQRESGNLSSQSVVTHRLHHCKLFWPLLGRVCIHAQRLRRYQHSDLIAVDGFFILDTTDPNNWEVPDWSLNVTLEGDPGLTMLLSMAVTDTAGSMVSAIANDPMGICDSFNTCLHSVDFTFQPIGSIGQPTQLTVTSLCVTLALVSFAPNQACNTNTASALFMASPVAVGAVPEPTALAPFGIGMLVIHPIQRRRYR